MFEFIVKMSEKGWSNSGSMGQVLVRLKNRARASPLMASCVTQILRQKLKWEQELELRSNLATI